MRCEALLGWVGYGRRWIGCGLGLGGVGTICAASGGGGLFATLPPGATSEGLAPTPGGRLRNSCSPSLTSWLVPIATATTTHTVVSASINRFASRRRATFDS